MELTEMPSVNLYYWQAEHLGRESQINFLSLYISASGISNFVVGLYAKGDITR